MVGRSKGLYSGSGLLQYMAMSFPLMWLEITKPFTAITVCISVCVVVSVRDMEDRGNIKPKQKRMNIHSGKVEDNEENSTSSLCFELFFQIHFKSNM